MQPGINISDSRKLISHTALIDIPMEFESMPLLDRAWVFLKRLLATRVVYFAPKLSGSVSSSIVANAEGWRVREGPTVRYQQA